MNDKRLAFENSQEEISFRSNKTLSTLYTYNITEFLPQITQAHHSNNLLSKTFAFTRKDKIMTEPNEQRSHNSTYEVNQLKRMINLLEEERIALKAQVEKSRAIISEKEANIANKDELVASLVDKNATLIRNIENLNKKKALEFYANCIQHSYLPRNKQTYQVSIQTDLVISLPNVSDQMATRPLTDRGMTDIYHKLQNLKLPIKSQLREARSNLSKPSQFYKAGWNVQEDKQNVMRASNNAERTIEPQRQIWRQQQIEVGPIEQSQLQRIISAYLQ